MLRKVFASDDCPYCFLKNWVLQGKHPEGIQCSDCGKRWIPVDISISYAPHQLKHICYELGKPTIQELL
jgi:hypothetical protein